MYGCDLTGATIWLTRPAGQNELWQEALQKAGARVLVEPLLRIDQPDDVLQAEQALDRCEKADIVIVASVNAVKSVWQLRPDWQPQGQLIAVGGASGRAFCSYFNRQPSVPDRFDTEGMLALSALQAVAGQKVALLAGHGGRQKLGQVLQERGARVEKIALYRRNPVQLARERLQTLLSSDVLVITSSEAWTSLINQLESQQQRQLARLRLVASSHNVVKLANRAITWSKPPIVIDRMGKAGALNALARAW